MNRQQIVNYYYNHGNSSGIGTDTNASGQRGMLVLGDSIPAGSNNSTGVGPTPTAGTVYQWNATLGQITQVTNDDVYNRVAGTFMPQYGIDYNTYTGYKACFIPCGFPGSNFEDDGSDNWSATGALRADAETKVTNCLAALGTTKLHRIIVQLGINSATGVVAIGTVEAAIDDFFLWLTTKYPGVPILVSQVGRNSSTAHNDRIYAVRYRILQNAINYSNVNMCFQAASWISSGGYGGDNLHPNQTGNNEWGKCMARWELNSAYSKWARSIISSLYGDISTARKVLIDACITAMGASYFLSEGIGVFTTTHQNSVYVDWSFLGYIFNSSGTWVADSHIATNGSNQHYLYSFIPTVNNKRGAQDDFFGIVRVKVNSTAQGTLAVCLGAGDATQQIRVGQTTTPNLLYMANDLTSSVTTGDLKIVDANAYGFGRSGGTKYLLKNQTEFASAVQALIAPTTRAPLIGALDNNGTVAARMNGQYQYVAFGKYSAKNTIISALETLIAAWPSAT